MNQSEKTLQSLVENARMGEYACQQLVDRCQSDIRPEIEREIKQYDALARRAESALEKMDIQPEAKGPMARMGMWMGMQMHTITDRSSAHYAELLIQGASMGVVEMTKTLNSNPDADGHARELAQEFITMQQENIEKLKQYLLQKTW